MSNHQNYNSTLPMRLAAVMEQYYRCKLGDVQQIAIGVSGGPDSMALCCALSDYFSENMPDMVIHALTVDHDLRPESGEEAAAVSAALSSLCNIEHRTLLWQHDAQPTSRIQEQARSARYLLMRTFMRERGINHLFLGHHMNDQAETFLFRLAKGSGLDGLACMSYKSQQEDGVFICRPFLEEGKSELQKFCEEKGLDYITDTSNEENKFARVRLRQSMGILSEEGLTPKRLSVTAKRISRAREALDDVAEKLYKGSILKIETDRLVFDLYVFANQHEEFVVRMLKKAMDTLQPDREYSARMQRIERLCVALMEPKSFEKRTLGGVVFECDILAGDLIMSREHPD